jgi:arylsulfatase/arylsulfatase A
VIDGTSLLALLEGSETAWPDRPLLLQCHRGLQPKRYQNCAVITHQYKMIGYPGSFNDENLKTSSENPVLELYDLINDPGEQKDLANTHPGILTSLRSAYDAWFDDVRSTRNFTPGYIHIGNPAENPTHLCRYQDSAYVNGEPTGWLVNIEREGDYEFTINRGDHVAPGRMCIRVNESVLSQPLGRSDNTATFHLPAGKARLEAWVQEEGKPHRRRPEQDTIGDVDLRRL